MPPRPGARAAAARPRRPGRAGDRAAWRPTAGPAGAARSSTTQSGVPAISRAARPESTSCSATATSPLPPTSRNSPHRTAVTARARVIRKTSRPRSSPDGGEQHRAGEQEARAHGEQRRQAGDGVLDRRGTSSPRPGRRCRARPRRRAGHGPGGRRLGRRRRGAPVLVTPVIATVAPARPGSAPAYARAGGPLVAVPRAYRHGRRLRAAGPARTTPRRSPGSRSSPGGRRTGRCCPPCGAGRVGRPTRPSRAGGMPSPRHPPRPHGVLVALEENDRRGLRRLRPGRARRRDERPDPAGPTSEVSILLVEPRWGRRGHGSRLLAAVADLAQGGGAARLQMWLLEADQVSAGFYESAGWGPDGWARTLDTGDEPLREVRWHALLGGAERGRREFRGIPRRGAGLLRGPGGRQLQDVLDRGTRRPTTSTCGRRCWRCSTELAPEFGAAKVFRPYRDVRFSNDKTPYKTHQGAVVHPEGDGGSLVRAGVGRRAPGVRRVLAAGVRSGRAVPAGGRRRPPGTPAADRGGPPRGAGLVHRRRTPRPACPPATTPTRRGWTC